VRRRIQGVLRRCRTMSGDVPTPKGAAHQAAQLCAIESECGQFVRSLGRKRTQRCWFCRSHKRGFTPVVKGDPETGGQGAGRRILKTGNVILPENWCIKENDGRHDGQRLGLAPVEKGEPLISVVIAALERENHADRISLQDGENNGNRNWGSTTIKPGDPAYAGNVAAERKASIRSMPRKRYWPLVGLERTASSKSGEWP